VVRNVIAEVDIILRISKLVGGYRENQRIVIGRVYRVTGICMCPGVWKVSLAVDSVSPMGEFSAGSCRRGLVWLRKASLETQDTRSHMTTCKYNNRARRILDLLVGMPSRYIAGLSNMSSACFSRGRLRYLVRETAHSNVGAHLFPSQPRRWPQRNYASSILDIVRTSIQR
jgi:hypothetical protein